MKYFVLVILAASVFSSCLNRENNPVEETNLTQSVIWPTAIGNMWIYHIQRFDTLGILQESYIDTTVVQDTLSFHGKLWYLFIGATEGFFANRSDGFYVGYPEILDRMRFKYPATVGDSILYTPTPITSSNLQMNSLTSCIGP